MKRSTSVVIGLVALVGSVLVTGQARAAEPEGTAFSTAVVVGEGPAPVSGSEFHYDTYLLGTQDPVVGVTAYLEVLGYGQSTFTKVASAVTDAEGHAAASVKLYRNASVRWSFPGNAGYRAAVSAAHSEYVGPRVLAKVKDATLKGRQKLVVTGRSVPARPGQRVSLWRGELPHLGGWGATRIGYATIRPDGTFRVTARFTKPGTKRIFVRILAGRGTADGYSRYLSVKVRR